MARAIVKSHSSSSIGSVKQSMLDEATFQSIHGTGWVLMDGRDLSVTNPGSAYETLTGQSTLPDARGQFLRGKNNTRSDGNEDPDGERGLGDFQVDKLQGHRHEMWIDNDLGAGSLNGGQRLHRADASRTGAAGTGDYIRALTPDGTNGTPRPGIETRPKNIAINIFIKINE
jgi:hypothetical protein